MENKLERLSLLKSSLKLLKEDEKIYERLLKDVTKHVTKVVNKHHMDVNKKIADYRSDLTKSIREVKSYISKIKDIMSEYDHQNNILPEQVCETRKILIAYSEGLQNVYVEVMKLKEKINK